MREFLDCLKEFLGDCWEAHRCKMSHEGFDLTGHYYNGYCAVLCYTCRQCGREHELWKVTG